MGIVASLHQTLVSGDHWLGPPRSAAWHEKALRIRAAAEQGFAVHGVHAVSFAGLAIATGTTPATLRRYFLDKEALLAAVCEAHLQRLADAVTRADQPCHTKPQRLVAMAAAYLDHLQTEGREGQRVLIQARPSLPEAMQGDLAARRRWIVAAFADVLGPPEDAQAEPLAEALLAALDAVPPLDPPARAERARLLAAMALRPAEAPLPEAAPPEPVLPEPILPEPLPPDPESPPPDPPAPLDASLLPEPEPEPAPDPPPRQWGDPFDFTDEQMAELTELLETDQSPDAFMARTLPDDLLVDYILFATGNDNPAQLPAPEAGAAVAQMTTGP